ncbi:MAG: peptidyl-prolyl cis-trans isomerase [Heliobacteriaceae bacterium]|nr:peptidyl-prolyl cis-trans isomerase [Heliobacteriaceae bacterium]
MRRLSTVLIWIVLGSLFLVLAGCNTTNMVATVNGDKIYRADLDKRVDRAKKEIAAQGNPSDQLSAEMIATIERQELERMIDEKLYEQEAQKRGIQVTDEQVIEELEKEKQRFENDAAYQKALKQADVTEAEIKEIIRTGLKVFKLYEAVTVDVQVTDDELRQYYQDNPLRFKQEKQVKASHILVTTEEEAKAVIADLNKGVEFNQLAVERSIDPSAAQNKGDLGYFEQDAMVKEFSDAAFALNKGEITRVPVKSTFGYHVIRVEDIKPEKQQSFEEVKDRLRVDLPAERKAEKFETWFNEIKAEAQIENKLPVAEQKQAG